MNSKLLQVKTLIEKKLNNFMKNLNLNEISMQLVYLNFKNILKSLYSRVKFKVIVKPKYVTVV